MKKYTKYVVAEAYNIRSFYDSNGSSTTYGPNAGEYIRLEMLIYK